MDEELKTLLEIANERIKELRKEAEVYAIEITRSIKKANSRRLLLNRIFAVDAEKGKVIVEEISIIIKILKTVLAESIIEVISKSGVEQLLGESITQVVVEIFPKELNLPPHAIITFSKTGYL